MAREDGFEQIIDGESFEIENESVFRFKCCDCGLVHKVAVAIEESGNIGFCMERENEVNNFAKQLKAKDEEIAELKSNLEVFRRIRDKRISNDQRRCY